MLSQKQGREAEHLVSEFQDIFTDILGETNIIEHKIELATEEPFRVKQYPLPYSTWQTVKDDVAKMLETGVIEESDSHYSSPIVLVKKKDGSTRFCNNF